MLGKTCLPNVSQLIFKIKIYKKTSLFYCISIIRFAFHTSWCVFTWGWLPVSVKVSMVPPFSKVLRYEQWAHIPGLIYDDRRCRLCELLKRYSIWKNLFQLPLAQVTFSQHDFRDSKVLKNPRKKRKLEKNCHQLLWLLPRFFVTEIRGPT